MLARGNCTRPMSAPSCFEQNPEWDPWDDPLERANILPPDTVLGTSPPVQMTLAALLCVWKKATCVSSQRRKMKIAPVTKCT